MSNQIVSLSFRALNTLLNCSDVNLISKLTMENFGIDFLHKSSLTMCRSISLLSTNVHCPEVRSFWQFLVYWKRKWLSILIFEVWCTVEICFCRQLKCGSSFMKKTLAKKILPLSAVSRKREKISLLKLHFSLMKQRKILRWTKHRGKTQIHTLAVYAKHEKGDHE